MLIGENAKLIRAKNAGPFMVTIDIIFENRNDYNQLKQSSKFNKNLLANIYQVEESSIRIYKCDEINTVKVTFKRKIVSGDVGDTDIFGGQMHGALVNLAV